MGTIDEPCAREPSIRGGLRADAATEKQRAVPALMLVTAAG